MNRMRKILSAVLALALILSFPGCNSAGKQLTPEEVIKTALQNLLNIKSVSYEFNVDTEFSVVGQTVATNTKTTADATLNPMNMKLNMVVSVGSYDATNLEMYALQEENGLTLYTCADGKNWMKQEGITADQIAQYNMMDAISLYLSTVSNLQEAGHEQIGDFDTVKYEGTLSSDAFSEVLKVSGMQEQLESLGVDAETAAGFYEELGELPITLWIHPSTFMPVKFEMDMTGMMNSLLNKVLGPAADTVTGSAGMEVGKVKMSCTFLGFNSVDSITVPDAVKNASAA